MSKVFEDVFSELQADMVSICLEYVQNKAEVIYIYCSLEEKVISSDFFCRINNMIVKKHKLNDALNDNDGFRYNTSVERQKAVLSIINEDIEKLYKLCDEYKKEMPTELKLVYDVPRNSLTANYKYELVYSNDPVKTADDIANVAQRISQWFQK